MKHVLFWTLLAGCVGAPDPKAQIMLLSATPALGSPIATATDIEVIFDYDLLEPGLKYGGVRAGTVRFDGYGRIRWSDGSTGSSNALTASSQLELGSEIHGRGVRWLYRADDLAAVIDHARRPKLDGSGRNLAVEGVDLMGRLTWSYGCAETQPGGTAECPANLGYFQALGPLVF